MPQRPGRRAAGVTIRGDAPCDACLTDAEPDTSAMSKPFLIIQLRPEDETADDLAATIASERAPVPNEILNHFVARFRR